MNALLHRKQPSVKSRNLSPERSVEVTESLAVLCFIAASVLLSIVTAMYTTMLPLSASWRNFWLVICLVTFGLSLIGVVPFCLSYVQWRCDAEKRATRPTAKGVCSNDNTGGNANDPCPSQTVCISRRANQVAGEIHDGLAQHFTAICMQLGAAKEQLSLKEGDPLKSIQRALDLAEFGLAEARRCAHNLRSSNESGLAVSPQRLVERFSVVGRLRCSFRSDDIPENNLPLRVQNGLFRIAQEAIHNAVRHANPTEIAVTLRWEESILVLQVTDNGSGIPVNRFEKSEGFGLRNMRERASAIYGRLEIQTAPGYLIAIKTRYSTRAPAASLRHDEMALDADMTKASRRLNVVLTIPFEYHSTTNSVLSKAPFRDLSCC